MTTFAGGPPEFDARVAPASARWALATCFAVSWFFVSAASYATGPLQTIPWLFVTPSAPAILIAVLGLFSLIGFAAPLLPLGAHWPREDVAFRFGVITIGAGLLVSASFASPLAWQASTVGWTLGTTAAVVATAAGAVFLNAIIGLANRRAVAGGLVAAILVKQALRSIAIEGAPLAPARVALAAAIVFAALGIYAAYRWRLAPAEDRAGSFERRAGGMRLRGALAFGVILFFEMTHGLPGLASLPPREAGRHALLLGGIPALLAPAGAWIFVMRAYPVPRHRLLAVTLSVLLTIGAIVPFWLRNDFALALLSAVVAHTAALILLGRVLAPASGRRSGRKLASGLVLFAALSVAHAASFLTSADEVSATHGRLPSAGVALVAGLILGVAMYLTPRPHPAAPPLSDRALFGIGALLALLALIATLV